MSENARGALAMALAMLCFCANDAVMKTMFAAAPLGQTIVVRGVFGVAFGLALAWRMGALGRLSAVLAPRVMLRSGLDTFAALAYLSALTVISLSTLVATLQATPLIATGLAALLMREQVGWRRWLATAVGLLGVLVVINPWAEDVPAGTAAMASLGLLAAFLAASRDLATRGVPRSIPTVLIALSSVAAITFMGAVVALIRGEVWRPLTWFGRWRWPRSACSAATTSSARRCGWARSPSSPRSAIRSCCGRWA